MNRWLAPWEKTRGWSLCSSRSVPLQYMYSILYDAIYKWEAVWIILVQVTAGPCVAFCGGENVFQIINNTYCEVSVGLGMGTLLTVSGVNGSLALSISVILVAPILPLSKMNWGLISY